MTDAFNPYAAPSANLNPQAHGAGDGCWRDGNVVVLPAGGDLPPRCVKCNAPAETPIKDRTFYWHHPALYVIALFALLIYVIIAMIVRKKATLCPGLCAEHRRRRTIGLVVGWLSPVVGFFVIVLGGSRDNCGVMALGFLLILAGLVGGMMMARILYAERIDDTYIRLKGAGADFLNSLPPFNG